MSEWTKYPPNIFRSLYVCMCAGARAPYAAANLFTLSKHHAQVQKQQFQIPTETWAWRNERLNEQHSARTYILKKKKKKSTMIIA